MSCEAKFWFDVGVLMERIHQTVSMQRVNIPQSVHGGADSAGARRPVPGGQFGGERIGEIEAFVQSTPHERDQEHNVSRV